MISSWCNLNIKDEGKSIWKKAWQNGLGRFEEA
jgi:hypothetical protein